MAIELTEETYPKGGFRVLSLKGQLERTDESSAKVEESPAVDTGSTQTLETPKKKSAGSKAGTSRKKRN